MTDATYNPNAAQVIGLFPTPFMRVPQCLDLPLLAALLGRFVASPAQPNTKSDLASHSELLNPTNDSLMHEVARRITPHVEALGELMFGERLAWEVKEMWVNRLQKGGFQALHNHANCFVSGIIYLTPTHASAQTVFAKGLGGREFVFGNAHSATQQGPFNADKWLAPQPAAGDMVLFPSYLLHEVPVNQGELRISLAFNAIPAKLDSWGYTTRFSK